MGKIKTKRLLKKSLLFVMVGIFSASVLYAAYPSKTVYAANAGNFTLFVGNPGQQRKSVADAWDAGGGDEYDNPGWGIMKVLSKNLGNQGALGKVTLPFDEKFTREIACDTDQLGPDQCESREPVFTTRYYCTLPNNKLLKSRPSNARTEYYEIVYAIGLKDNGNSGDEFVGRNTYNATGGPILVKKFERSGDSTYTREVVTRDITDHGKSPDDFDDPRTGGQNGRDDDDWGIDGGSDAGCRPSNAMTGTMDIKNYNRLSPAEKNAFSRPGSGSPAGGGGGGGGGAAEDNELTDCDLKASNPLSWIICPIIDAGANGTDWIFQNIIEPLLSDIPLSTDPRNEFFKAWQGFRLIANIILVIGMLGIVYSMARGDR